MFDGILGQAVEWICENHTPVILTGELLVAIFAFKFNRFRTAGMAMIAIFMTVWLGW